MLSFLFAVYLFQAAYLDLYNQGHTLLEQGKPKEAEVVLKEAASLNPKYIPTLKDLSESYVKLNRLPEAVEQYEKIVNINPGDVNARGRLAELYSWAGNHDKSIVTYRDALEIDPKNLGLKTGLATVLRWSQRHYEAESLYKEVLQSDPEIRDALKGLAKTYSMAGNLSTAVETLEKSITIYREDAELHKELGTADRKSTRLNS